MKKLFLALFACLILFSFNSISQIVYTDVVPDFVGDSVNQWFNLDLNDDNINDYNFGYDKVTVSCNCDGNISMGHSKRIYLSTEDSSESITGSTTFNLVANLLYHDIIDSNSSWTVFDKRFIRNAWCYDCSPTGASYSKIWDGLWLNAQNRYAGLRIIKDGNYYYGWARLDVDSDSFVLKDYAYNTIPGKGILAGDTNDIVSVKEVENIYSLSVLPNPASDECTVYFYSKAKQKLFFTLVDNEGKIILSEVIIAEYGLNRKDIELSGLLSGLYLISINGISSKIFVKK